MDFQGRYTNKNVRIVLSYTFLNSVSRSIWGANVLSAYVYVITGGSNSQVGYLTGVLGTAQVLAAPFCAYLADRYRRDRMLKVAGAWGVCCSLSTAASLVLGNYWALCLCMLGWGAFYAASNPALEALFADSVPLGKRSDIFTTKYMLLQAANSTGPLLAVVMFSLLGDYWDKRECTVVVLVGLCLSVVPALLLFTLNDRNALDQDQAGRAEQDPEGLLLRKPLIPRHQPPAPVGGSMASPLQINGGAEDEEEKADGKGDGPGVQLPPPAYPYGLMIPSMCALADVISGVASGMSIKFFPIFFLDTLSQGPVMVQSLYTVCPLATSLGARGAQLLSKKLGRGYTKLLVKGLGISLLVLICVLESRLLPRWGFSPTQSFWVLAPIFVLRTALMNSPKALTRSIIMDSVPKEHRAKWSALESVNTATWSGSAVIGGILVDR